MAASTYKDGIMYDPKLPTAYRKAKSTSKMCSNCAYILGGKCTLWKGAAVRGTYVCGKWQEKGDKPVTNVPNVKRDPPPHVGLKGENPKESFIPRQTGKRRLGASARQRRANALGKSGASQPAPSARTSRPTPSAPSRSSTSRPSPTRSTRTPAPAPRRRNTNQQNRTSSGGGY